MSVEGVCLTLKYGWYRTCFGRAEAKANPLCVTGVGYHVLITQSLALTVHWRSCLRGRLELSLQKYSNIGNAATSYALVR